MLVRTRVERGIAKVPNGYIVAEVHHGRDDGGLGDEHVFYRKLLAGPFKGTGAKRLAIDAAGTNRTVAA